MQTANAQIWIAPIADPADKELVSVSNQEVTGNGSSVDPRISANGRFVVFTSAASNLVGADFNNVPEVFRRDLPLGTTDRISVDDVGSEANAPSTEPSIDGAGDSIVFTSEASDLEEDGIDDPVAGSRDVFLRDQGINPYPTPTPTTSPSATHRRRPRPPVPRRPPPRRRARPPPRPRRPRTADRDGHGCPDRDPTRADPTPTMAPTPTPPPPPDGAVYVPLNPSRVLDTRDGTGLVGPFANAIVRGFQVGGRGGVPSDALAVTANLTVTGHTSSGYASLGPTMTADPTTSTINVTHGQTGPTGSPCASARPAGCRPSGRARQARAPTSCST